MYYYHLITVLFCSHTHLLCIRGELNNPINVFELSYFYLSAVSSFGIFLLPSYHSLILLSLSSPLCQRRIEQSYYCPQTVLLLSHHSFRSFLLPSYHSLILLSHTTPLCQRRIEYSYYYLITLFEVSYYHVITVLFCSSRLLLCENGELNNLVTVLFLSHHSLQRVLLAFYLNLTLLFRIFLCVIGETSYHLGAIFLRS